MKISQKVKFLITPKKRLSSRVLFAGFWMTAIRISVRCLGFVRIVILARLLSPEDFGLVGVGVLTIELMYAFSKTGFADALIQQKEDIKDYLNTAWVMNLIRNLLLGIIIFSCAPLIASFFNSVEARPIVQTMAVLVIIRGLINPGIIYLNKELEIQKRFILEVGQTVLDLSVSIAVAIVLRNVWALVFGAIAGHLAHLILSYIIHPYRPRISFDWLKAKSMFNFGKWLTISSWATYLCQKGDSIIIGRLLGTTSLGIYQMGRRVSDLFSADIMQGTMDVAFPAYSKLQDRIPTLRRAFLLSVSTMTSIIFPLGVAIFFVAPDFVPVVLGEQWTTAIPVMRVMGFTMSLQCLIAVGKSLFYGINRPALEFGMTGLATFVIFTSIYPLINTFGMQGGAIAVLIGYCSALPIMIWRSSRLLEIQARDYLLVFLSPMIIVIAIIISTLAIEQVPSQVGLAHLLLLSGTILIVFIIMAILLWKIYKGGPLQIIGLIKESR